MTSGSSLPAPLPLDEAIREARSMADDYAARQVGAWTVVGRVCAALLAELERLQGIERDVNTPHTADFLEAVRLEAAHQRARWSAEHDAGKTDADWFWLIGYLGGKAVNAGKLSEVAAAMGDEQDAIYHRGKRLHHVITTAAACLNWHAKLTGSDSRMRPGIDPQGVLGG